MKNFKEFIEEGWKINKNTYFMGKDVGPVHSHHSGYTIAKISGKWIVSNPDDEKSGEFHSLAKAKSEVADLTESVELEEAKKIQMTKAQYLDVDVGTKVVFRLSARLPQVPATVIGFNNKGGFDVEADGEEFSLGRNHEVGYAKTMGESIDVEEGNTSLVGPYMDMGELMKRAKAKGPNKDAKDTPRKKGEGPEKPNSRGYGSGRYQGD